MAADLPGVDVLAGNDRYREIFYSAPVSLWDQDFSGVAAFLDDLRRQGVSDLRAHLLAHPEQVQEALRRVKVIDVNAFTLDLFEVDRQQDLQLSLSDIFVPDTASIFIDELVTLWNGHRRFAGETRLRTFTGRQIEVAFTINFQGPRFERTLVSLQDITARRSAERVGSTLAAVVESSEDAILTKNLDGIITSWNQGATELFGFAPEEAIGRSVTILIPEDRQDEEPLILKRIRAGERIEPYETIRRRKDGSLIDISLSVSPLKLADGTIIGASKIARDITERKRAQEQERLLVREMNHRIKNLFALASGIISLSARDAQTPQDLKSKATERLTALARVHSLTLSRHGDLDAAATMPATLHALIRAILAPYEPDPKAPERVQLEGSDLTLSASATTSFALLVHEFATNAAKYGALSAEHGRIEIKIATTDRQLTLTWSEYGGPAVVSPTAVEGFGSYLAQATVKTLNGEIDYDWASSGITLRLKVALDRIKA